MPFCYSSAIAYYNAPCVDDAKDNCDYDIWDLDYWYVLFRLFCFVQVNDIDKFIAWVLALKDKNVGL